MKRFLLAWVSIVAVGMVLSLRADDTPKPAAGDKPPDAIKGEALENQVTLARRFQSFEQALIRLAQKLERSSKPEDREKAANLKKAMALVSDEGVTLKFEKLIATLQKPSTSLSLNEIKDAMEQNKMLAEDIRAILQLLLSDDRDAWLKAEIKRLMELLKELDKVIREQKVQRANVEGGRVEKNALEKGQHKVTEDTEKIAKAMGGKDGKDGDAKKSDGKPDGKGDGKGQGSQGQPKKGNDNPQPSDPNQKPSDATPGKKQVQDANDFQKQAEDEIKKEKKDEASNKQSLALKKLEEARKKLEEILRQLREEEIERLLADLERRCRRMLEMQIEVYDGTVRVDKAIGANADKKPSRAEEQRALQLADREEAIVVEANKAIQILEAEGTAVAFPEVFIQVRDDMKIVARRLGKADVGSVTQITEQDIIATLKDMIEALKKAQQDRQSGGQSGPSQPQDQKLIDLLAELKMIRAMQIRVNSRTRVYGEQYKGEQAEVPEIKTELNNLAQRQFKIFEVTNNIAKGKNK
jgi:tetratricopeptide (TPR) repeat protein